MGVLTIVWLGLGGSIALMWLVRLVLLGPLLARRQPFTPVSGASLPACPPKVSVLVAARDEEATIEACITSLLAQDYPSLEIIAINDRSRDRTGEILADFATRAGDRLSAVTIERLPTGWYGKPHAMRRGIERATGRWLLFTDADCVFEHSGTISVAVAAALRGGTDFLTIIPALKAPTWWERLLQPVCALVLMFWFQPEKVNDPQSPAAYANGAFMLMRREVLGWVGGYEAVRGELNEDIKLARLAKAAGASLRVEENVGLYHTRMYATLRQALGGWSRIFAGALGQPGNVMLALIVLVFFSVGPWCGFLLSVTSGDGFFEAALPAPLVWGTAVVLMQLTMLRLYEALGFGAVWSLGYLLGAVGLIPILVSSLMQVTGATTTTWRDVTYRARAARPPDAASQRPGESVTVTDGPVS